LADGGSVGEKGGFRKPLQPPEEEALKTLRNDWKELVMSLPLQSTVGIGILECLCF